MIDTYDLPGLARFWTQALGARQVDIGQTGAESWTVLADPEGDEFCVVRPKETLTR